MRCGRVSTAAAALTSAAAIVAAMAIGTTGTPPEVARAAAMPAPAPWRTLGPGLEFAVFAAPSTAPSGDARIRVLRVDPDQWELRLLCATAPDQGRSLTPREWCRRNGLAAAVNASMYAQDYRTSVSLLRSRGHVNNPRVTRHKAVLAFDPLDGGVPPVQIIDREQQDFEGLSLRYGSLVQSIRMVSLDGRNVWERQPESWSALAAGMARDGRVLFIHVQIPLPMHELIEILLALPLDLRNLMYLEGGPPAQMFVQAGGETIELAGVLRGGGRMAGHESIPSPVPNVIGVVRRAAHQDAEGR